MLRNIGRLTPAVLLLILHTSATSAHARADEPGRFQDSKIVRVNVKTPEELEGIERTGATILNCIPATAPMDVLVTPAQLTALEQLGLPARVLTENVQAWVDAGRAAAVRANPFGDFFLDYHPYGDADTTGTIVWYMNELVTRYPALTSMVNVGATLQGRTIQGLRISNDAIAGKPAVVYFGCEHAREWITPTVPLYVATHLLENYDTDTTVTDLVDNVEFLLIPVFNVDGYVYTWTANRLWRKNRRPNGDGTYGVDLNRNWSEGWGGPGSSGSTSSTTFRGPSPFSEPETRVLRDFFLEHPNVRAQLDIHSYSELILWPYGYTPDLPPDQDVYLDVGLAMQSLVYGVHGVFYTAGPAYSTIYPASGISLDWTYSRLGILSYTYELRPATWSEGGFELPAEQIIPNNEEVLPAVLHLADSDWVRSPMRFAFPDGIPATIKPGGDTAFIVDLIPQSEAAVPDTVRMFHRYDSAGPYIETPLAPLGGDSYAAALPATNCTSVPEFYFRATGDGGTTLINPRDAPDGRVYSAGVATGNLVFFDEDLSVNPGWTVQGQWAWGQPNGSGGEYGGPDPTSGHTDGSVYGYNLSGDYPNDIPEYHLTSPPIDCTGRSGVHLSFWRWLGVEQASFDHASVSVSNNGADWVTVWQNTTEVADSAWTLQELDISAIADDQPTVYLQWTMGPTDGAWRYCGWNIDDIQLYHAVCEGVAGDYDGDGDLDADDYRQFELCFTGPTGPVGPGCGIVDFDSDGNVDCDDWFAFRSAWSGPSAPPSFGVCEVFSQPTPDPFVKNRYLSFIPRGPSDMPQAFRVTIVSNPLFPSTVGRQKWVILPGVDGIAKLGCNPVYGDWGFERIDVGDVDIVPGAAYAVETTLDGVEFLEPVVMETVPAWADIVGAFQEGGWTVPNGTVDILDAVAVLDAYRHFETAPPSSWCDINPAVPDGVIDIMDAVRVIDAFRGFPYPFAAPTECP